MKKYKPVHIIHLLLYAPDTSNEVSIPIEGRTRLMKMVFLFQKELSKYFEDQVDTDSFDFESYHYGPFSKKVFEALNFLETREIIKTYTLALEKIDSNEISLERQLINSENQDILYDNDNNSEIYYPQVFELTEIGKRIMEDERKWFAWVNLSMAKRNTLTKFKTNMINTSVYNILRYVYTKYPSYAEKSYIKNLISLNNK